MPRSHRHFVLVIHGARADNPALRNLVRWVRAKGHRIEPRVTWERGDAQRFAQQAAEAGDVDCVIAVGGDGTVNEVANGLAGSRCSLGIIPVGTANDFARQAGIPLDADHAMDVILHHKAMRVDLGALNGRRFLNVSSGGVGAEATAETSAEAKEVLGMFAYAITGVRKLRELVAKPARFAGPGFELRAPFLLFAVGNARETGGGTMITPKASMTDGLLDLCVVEAMPRAEFARLVLSIRRGEHLGHAGVHYVQLPWVEVESQHRVTVNLDGEPLRERQLRYEARPGELLVHVVGVPGADVLAGPRGRPLAEGEAAADTPEERRATTRK